LLLFSYELNKKKLVNQLLVDQKYGVFIIKKNFFQVILRNMLQNIFSNLLRIKKAAFLTIRKQLHFLLSKRIGNMV